MWDFLLDIIFPRFCLGCGKFGDYICQDCRKNRIEYFDEQVCPYCEKPSPMGLTHPRCKTQNGLDGMFVLAHYRGLVPELIHKIKYQSAFAVCEELAGMIGEKYHGEFEFDYFVPVPLSPKRERERGFNQAYELAKELGKSTGYSVIKLLVRTRNTRPQFDLKYKERQKNMIEAFSISPKLIATSLNGYSFCLVDDVATTGATIFECAKVLKKTGAKNVWAICVARGG